MKNNASINKGQAMITLLFFVIIVITITSGAVTIMIVNAFSSDRIQQNTVSYYVAESGIENALLRLLRDPGYTGEMLPVGDETVEITVAGSTNKTITASTNAGNSRTQLEVTAEYIDNVLTVTNWKEIY